MFIQTIAAYKKIMMGDGIGSIYDLGCYLVSFVNGLNRSGYSFTPEQMNQILKDKDLWISATKNYIDVANLVTKWPEIFISFKQVEPWNDMAYLASLMSNEYVVIGKVDASGISGTGTHFVLITSIDGVNAIIFDPWTGEHQAVSIRYGKLGNILGLRVFKIKPKIGSTTSPGDNTMPETMTVNKSDWDRLFKASELGDKLLTMVGGTGNIADKSIDDLQRLTDNFSFNSYSNGIIAGKKSVVTPTEVPEEITNNGKKWILNGLNWIDGKLNGNYKQE